MCNNAPNIVHYVHVCTLKVCYGTYQVPSDGRTLLAQVLHDVEVTVTGGPIEGRVPLLQKNDHVTMYDSTMYMYMEGHSHYTV